MEEELKCKICGKLASEDTHFYPRKMLCNRHYLQLQRHGEIICNNEVRHKYEKVCGICKDDKSNRYTMWSGDDEYKGVVLCQKHYAQLRNNGYLLDNMPSLHNEEKVCCICGSNINVHYSKLFNGLYCGKHYSQLYNLGELKEKTVFDRNDYIVDGNIAYIILRNKKQEETGRTIIDIDDLDNVIQYKWTLNTWGYAETKINKKSILMQRLILNEFSSNKIPDHINRNPLDNRKENLRIADKSLNAVNAGTRTSNTSGVTGVSWDKNANSWRAYISYKGKRIELGHRKDFDKAVILRLDAENKYYSGMQPQKELFKKYGVEIDE